MQFGFVRLCQLAVAGTVASACATSPPPMPPRRIAFTQPAAVPTQRPPDLVRPAEPPIVHERYAGWTLAADAVSLIPLTYWMGRPEDVYFALPSLLLPPIIHLAHGESERAAISLVLRSAMLGGVYLAGRSAQTECDNSSEFVCIPFRSLFLAELAIVPVLAIDALFLARKVRRKESWKRLPLQPSIAATADGRRWLSLSGRF